MTDDEIQLVINALAHFPEGASIADLESFLETPRRTLQRWLRELTSEDRIKQSGKGKSTRYHARIVNFSPAPMTAARRAGRIQELCRRSHENVPVSVSRIKAGPSDRDAHPQRTFFLACVILAFPAARMHWER